MNQNTQKSRLTLAGVIALVGLIFLVALSSLVGIVLIVIAAVIAGLALAGYKSPGDARAGRKMA